MRGVEPPLSTLVRMQHLTRPVSLGLTPLPTRAPTVLRSLVRRVGTFDQIPRRAMTRTLHLALPSAHARALSPFPSCERAQAVVLDDAATLDFAALLAL